MQWTCWGSTAGVQSLGFLGVVHGQERNKPGLHVASYGRITWPSCPLQSGLGPPLEEARL